MIKRFSSAAKAAFAGTMLFFAITATAQETDKISEGAKIAASEMKTKLVLNDNQYTQVVDVNKAYLKKVKDCKASGDTAPAKAKKMQAINEERDAKFKSVLTETQYKKYASVRAENLKKLKETAGI
ncbi:hypothetical protein R1T16_12215 [Flavobacterium sp. DG1-102-2]|uniref:hypothetical protein n=1 Tax=Flavobacterium sp. DG1-102-2 TaxID=3081663 RepID=UPI0029499E54|nr:hypothetical protein [Flavobacterium sp. DG1-102-2]MDV6169191.1 hypothetical protein [Flavobacterium sp. DG1-102-2]